MNAKELTVLTVEPGRYPGISKLKDFFFRIMGFLQIYVGWCMI